MIQFLFDIDLGVPEIDIIIKEFNPDVIKFNRVNISPQELIDS
jgi:hypothetical protein